MQSLPGDNKTGLYSNTGQTSQEGKSEFKTVFRPGRSHNRTITKVLSAKLQYKSRVGFMAFEQTEIGLCISV